LGLLPGRKRGPSEDADEAVTGDVNGFFCAARSPDDRKDLDDHCRLGATPSIQPRGLSRRHRRRIRTLAPADEIISDAAASR
jgi:hypothetical protein